MNGMGKRSHETGFLDPRQASRCDALPSDDSSRGQETSFLGFGLAMHLEGRQEFDVGRQHQAAAEGLGCRGGFAVFWHGWGGGTGMVCDSHIQACLFLLMEVCDLHTPIMISAGSLLTHMSPTSLRETD